MSKRYTGGVVSSAVPTVNAASASGIFTLGQQASAQSNNNWPPYKVEKSLRFRNSASARLTRTPAVAGNKQIWTMSFWLKTSKSNFDHYLFESSTDGGNNERTVLAFNSGKLQFRHIDGGSAVLSLETSQVFRDPSAWYHIVLAVDTTQATSSNRVKMYLNGSQITAFGTSTYPSQNLNTDWNGAAAHAFGASTYPDAYADGYFSEIYNIDGQALTPSSFGGTDKDGNWSPIAYTGTYGQNGFYLNFKDATSTTTIGYDYSGNGNHWTLSGFNVATANTTYDSMIDVPEDQAGSNSRGNYCTLNPLHYAMGGANYYTINNANQRITGTSASNSGGTIGTMASATGKFYYEVNMTGVDASGYVTVGACDVDQYSGLTSFNYLGYGSKSYGYFSSGTKTNNNGTSAYGATFTTGDVIGVAIDCDNGAIYFSKNGTWQNSGVPTSGATKTGAAYTWTAGSQKMIPQIDVYRTGSIADTNFGQRDFSYTPPADYKTFCTTNLPEPTIKSPNKHFAVSTYTGTGAAQTINSGLDLSNGGLVWTKTRSNVVNHDFRSSGLLNNYSFLQTNTTNAENNTATQYATTFNSTGYSIDSYGDNINQNTYTFVSWQWKTGAVVTNNSGTISSQVRANPTAGFSIISHSGTGSNSLLSVGHGLGTTPALIIMKARQAGIVGTDAWVVFHSSFSAGDYMTLNTTNAKSTSSNYWGNTLPTTSVFYVSGSSAQVGNESGVNYITYAWSQVPGYSAFGSYVGNG